MENGGCQVLGGTALPQPGVPLRQGRGDTPPPITPPALSAFLLWQGEVGNPPI